LRAVVIYLGLALLPTSSDLPETLLIWRTDFRKRNFHSVRSNCLCLFDGGFTGTPGRRFGLLFGLAPGGVCHASTVTSAAVRSYRTFSPLPCRLAPTFGGLFSVALSRIQLFAGRVGVTHHHALRCSDFPPVMF